MLYETKTLALYLLRALYHATDGKPQPWRILEELEVVTTDAIEFAVARGWVIVDLGRSVFLTDAGRRQVEPR
jgi:hypothetical protein